MKNSKIEKMVIKAVKKINKQFIGIDLKCVITEKAVSVKFLTDYIWLHDYEYSEWCYATSDDFVLFLVDEIIQKIDELKSIYQLLEQLPSMK